MMPPSITKYGSAVRLDTQILALRLHCARTALKAPPKGRIHVIVPFIGRKNGTLTARQQCYNDVHGWYRAHIEQLFARLWHAR